VAEKLLANIDDDPIPNIKVKRIIRRFTEPYIQYLSFPGFYSPSVADIIRLTILQHTKPQFPSGLQDAKSFMAS
jgi:hypothetical protein